MQVWHTGMVSISHVMRRIRWDMLTDSYRILAQRCTWPKFLVGDYTKGERGMKIPPLKNDPYNPGLRYDSVVDKPSKPSMYIIFQIISIIPSTFLPCDSYPNL